MKAPAEVPDEQALAAMGLPVKRDESEFGPIIGVTISLNPASVLNCSWSTTTNTSWVTWKRFGSTVFGIVRDGLQRVEVGRRHCGWGIEITSGAGDDYSVVLEIEIGERVQISDRMESVR